MMRLRLPKQISITRGVNASWMLPGVLDLGALKLETLLSFINSAHEKRTNNILREFDPMESDMIASMFILFSLSEKKKENLGYEETYQSKLFQCQAASRLLVIIIACCVLVIRRLVSMQA